VRVLFVCTANVCRSPAAEEIFRAVAWGTPDWKEHAARSAGTAPDPGGRGLTRDDLEWADLVCVMEQAHADFIRARWPGQVEKVRVLGIPDVYLPGDTALRDILTDHVWSIITAP
jgi:predicted protein tyrosine phosphatase